MNNKAFLTFIVGIAIVAVGFIGITGVKTYSHDERLAKVEKKAEKINEVSERIARIEERQILMGKALEGLIKKIDSIRVMPSIDHQIYQFTPVTPRN